MKETWDTLTNEQLVLEYQATRSDELFEYFLSRNMGLIMDYCGGIIAKHPDQKDDILQSCRMALWEAMVNYKTDSGAKFTTYSYFYFRKNMWHHWHHQLPVSMPINLMGHTDEVKEKLPNVMLETTSMDQTMDFGDGEGSGSFTLGDTLASPEPSPLDVLLEKDGLDYVVSTAKRVLSPRQYQILILYFGLDRHEARTLQEVADMYNLTRERIRQILEKALIKLRKYLKGDCDETYNNDED